MRPWKRSNDRSRDPAPERGTASLEFLTLGVLLLVPLVYLVLALAAVQAGTFAVEGAARHAARAAALATDAARARANVDRYVRAVLDDAGIDAAVASISMTCEPTDACAEPGTRIRVEVVATIPLPLVPDLLGNPIGTARLKGVATQTVSKYAAGLR